MRHAFHGINAVRKFVVSRIGWQQLSAASYLCGIKFHVKF